MSIAAWNWVTHNPEIRTRTDYCVMMALANYADPDGWCHPGHERLARESRSSRKTVQRTLDELVARGLLIRRQRAGRTCEYRLPIGRITLPPELKFDYDNPQPASSGDAGDRLWTTLEPASQLDARHGDAPPRNDATPASPGDATPASPGDARTVKNRQVTVARERERDPDAWRRIPEAMRVNGTQRVAALKAQLAVAKLATRVDEVGTTDALKAEG
jgi:hypothetical protein